MSQGSLHEIDGGLMGTMSAVKHFLIVDGLPNIFCSFFRQQPLSATNFLHELDKITQEIVTVSV